MNFFSAVFILLMSSCVFFEKDRASLSEYGYKSPNNTQIEIVPAETTGLIKLNYKVIREHKKPSLSPLFFATHENLIAAIMA